MSRTFVSLLTICFVFVLGFKVSGQVPADKIFPDSTKGFVVIRNLKDLADQWKKTQIGILLNDPVMQPFKDDMQSQLDQRMQNLFGLTLDGIEQLPSGEVAVGMIAIPNEKPGYVFSMDVNDRLDKVEDYLRRLDEKFLKTGTTKQLLNYKDQTITIYQFPERFREEKPSEVKAPEILVDRKAYLVIKDKHLLVSDQLYLIQLIADRMSSSDGKSLADVEDYQKTMQRCLEDVPKDSDPIIRWYIEPLNYGESIRALMRGPVAERRKKKPSIFTTLKEQGFDSIRGVGGAVCLMAEEKEVVYRSFIYTKKPYRLAMQMFTFPDNANFTPPNWIPGDIARCTMMYVDPNAIFDNFGTLFDALVMQGEKGAWDDILLGLKEDENGPQIDIRNELIVHLGQRVLGMTKYSLPITPTSESVVFAVELKDGKEPEIAKALQKLFSRDTEMQQKKHKNYILWLRVPSEGVIEPYSESGGVADLVPTGKTKTEKSKKGEGEEDAPPMFPDGAMTVAKGCLFVGTNGDYLVEILDRLDAKNASSVRDNAEYKEVDRVFAGFGVTDKPHFLQFFSRTDETLRPTYELVKQGKMPQSQALIGKVINALFVPSDEHGKPAIRQQAFDGSKLPDFEIIRHRFGPSGFYGVTEENGYFLKGFILKSPNGKPESK